MSSNLCLGIFFSACDVSRALLRRLLGWLLVAALLEGTITSTHAENFLCSDAELVQVAEGVRRQSAQYWSGQALPGDWFTPCPIVVRSWQPSGGGETQFRFENGEVSGWRMQVSGTRSELLQDVIPHEVDHMVRASLVRRPIVRWLDEGCASLRESPASHARLRLIASRIPADVMTPAWLEQQQYPTQSVDIERLYAGGFSLVEFLLTRGSPQTLLQLQQGDGTVAVRLQRSYQLSPESLCAEWDVWRKRRSGIGCREAGCALHEAAPAATTKPLLVVWSATWCPACERFQSDMRQLTGFRQMLQEHFEIQLHDADQQSALAKSAGIESLPTFVTAQTRLTGYSTPEQLLQQLGLAPSANPSLPVKDADANEPAVAPLISNPTQQETASTPPEVIPVTATPAVAATLPPLIPLSLTLLQLTGLIGSTVVTGGVGGLVSMLALGLIRQLLERKTSTPETANEGSAAQTAAPFPRVLDEAGQLLALRQPEGRVAVLDALRGLFLDDELEKYEQSGDTQFSLFARQLRTTIDARVDEVAPLSTNA